jgi:RNA polymerase sigma-B factor
MTVSTISTKSDEKSAAKPGRLDPRLREQIRELFLELAATENPTRREHLREQLCEVNAPLVRYLARRFKNTAEPMDDIVQVGMLGLVKAIDRYDVERGLEFSTFAVPTVLGEIRRYFRDATWATHVPRGARELYSSIVSVNPDLTQRLGRPPTPSDVAERLGTSVEAVLEAMDAGAAYSTSSLESAAETDGGDDRRSTLRMEDERLEQVEQRAALRPALASLPERQREALVLRFVGDLTQTQIADVLGVSQMQVSRLLSKSTTRLRALLADPELLSA